MALSTDVNTVVAGSRVDSQPLYWERMALPELNPDEQNALDHLFTYKPNVGPESVEHMVQLREKAKELAALILKTCPRSAHRSTAIRHLTQSVMWANSSIVLEGRNLP